VSRVAVAILIFAGLALASLAACSAPRPPLSVKSEDTDVKILAIKKAVRARDKSVVPQLVEDLSSDDPAVRFYAIEALQELTGQTFEYRYYEDDNARKPAIEKWKQWLAGQGR
jgi:HEAT repeats